MGFAENMIRLRRRLGLSQEALAARLNVSRKAVQNWENGSSVPDGIHLMSISEKLDVSIDSLFGISRRYSEEHMDKMLPTKNRMHWECYEKDLLTELRQCLDEGKDMSAYEGLITELASIPDSPHKAAMADTVFQIIGEAVRREAYEYYEPSRYPDIKAATSDCPRTSYDRDTITSRIYGAWLGRVCGCLLGKPVEGMRTETLLPLLRETGNYPMHRYITYEDIVRHIPADSPLMQPRGRTWADLVDAGPADDDTNYTVMSSLIVGEYGRDFTPVNVLDAWLKYQPKDAYCTAERVAWRNYFNGYMPPYTAIYKNPYREYIGAQIRVDYYGYINPGDPSEAARMAYNDACISHTKNGIYGAMYIAAMIARAAVCDDITEVVRTALSQVPQRSRLHEEMGVILNMYLMGNTVDECRRYIHSRYDEYTDYGWCHTISNAMIVTMALLYHPDDFGAAICCAVETGFDTDCNGATVGSVFGMMHGRASIPEQWTIPTAGKLRTNIFGYEIVDIETLVSNTLKHIRTKD